MSSPADVEIPASFARSAWESIETFHAIVYFAPEKKTAYEEAGLKGGWMGYFASRAAALGPASPELVHACFYNFHPNMVRRSIPDAWRFSTPERVLRARYITVALALARLLGPQIRAPNVQDALDVARSVIERCDPAGRPMFAAHLTLPWPADPYVALWHACTLLREHRGDAHITALMTVEIDGCEALLLRVASGEVPTETLRPYRGWSEEEWSEAADRLRARGLLGTGERLTEAGMDLSRAIEAETDRLSIAPWRRIGEDRSEWFLDAMRPLVATIVDGGGISFPNPMVLARPT